MAEERVFRAENIDVHLTEDGKTAILTVVNFSEGITVVLPRIQLGALGNRIAALCAEFPFPPLRQ
ncbi:MAG TPA: hypothetical protein VMS78_04090 [Rhizomicrobium sp.]|nr:hypothetical protein [Rhizomicrobium sp.]